MTPHFTFMFCFPKFAEAFFTLFIMTLLLFLNIISRYIASLPKFKAAHFKMAGWTLALLTRLFDITKSSGVLITVKNSFFILKPAIISAGFLQ